MKLSQVEDEYVAKLALDIKMQQYGITEAQFKCIMYQVSELEALNESASFYSNTEHPDSNIKNEFNYTNTPSTPK